MGSEKSLEALTQHSQNSLKATRRKLEAALSRLVHGNPRRVKKGSKITAAAVAAEAEVDRATLYRFHEPILAQIRKINHTAPRTQLKAQRSELAEAEAKLKEYRKLVEEAQAEVAALARINYRLDLRIHELETQLQVRDARIANYQKQMRAPTTLQKVVTLPNAGDGETLS